MNGFKFGKSNWPVKIQLLGMYGSQGGNPTELGIHMSPPLIREIRLYRRDLGHYYRNFRRDSIDLHSFKSSSISREEIRHASRIIFIDINNREKVLKDRYNTTI